MIQINYACLYTRLLFYSHGRSNVVSLGNCHGASQLLDAAKISCFAIFGGQREIQVVSENYNQNDSKFLSSGRGLASPSRQGQPLPHAWGFHETVEEQIWKAAEHSSNYHFNK